jgi:hypothetical protein
MTDEPAREELVTLVTTDKAFEAHAIAAVLRDEGFDAIVFESAYEGVGLPRPGTGRVAVRVPERELDEARTALDRAYAESAGIDWDAVDVGEREDDLPLHESHRTPKWVWVALVIAAVLIVIGMFGWIVALFV